MEDFSQLDGGGGGGGGGTSSGVFRYFPLTTTTSTVTHTTTIGTKSTAPPTSSASAVYGRSHGLLPSISTASCTLPYLQTSCFNAEAGSSQRRTVDAHREPQVDVETIKAKIVSHPQYYTLLGAFMDCQKIGAPPNVVERLSAIGRQMEPHKRRDHEGSSDPELDQFMEAYCNMLIKYREELTRPLQEATEYLKRIEAQFNTLLNISATSSSRLFSSGNIQLNQFL